MKRCAATLIALVILTSVPTAWAQKGGRRPTSEPAAKAEQGPAGKAKESTEPKPEPTRQTLLDPAAWAPADALVYVGINDVADTWQDIQKTSAYSLMSEPAGPAGLPGSNIFGGFVGELKTRLAKALDVPPERLQNPLAGPAAFFITAPFGAQAKEVEPGLVAGVGDAVLMKTYYDAAIAKLTARGKHEKVSAGSDTIDVFTLEREKRSGEAAEEKEFERLDAGRGLAGLDQTLKKGLDDLLPAKLALCLTADRVIMAGSAEHIQAVLRHDESIKTIADSDDYKALVQNLKPAGDIRFIVNLPRIIEMIPAAAAPSEAKEQRKKIKAWGLDGLGSLVGQCRLGAASYESKIEALLLLGTNRTGLVKLLDGENQPTAPPGDAAADTCAWATWNVDVAQWLDALESGVLQPSESTGTGAGRSWMEHPLPDGGTINLRQALLDYLRGPLTFGFGVGPSSGAPARILLAIGHSDQAAVTKFLTGPLMQDYLKAREAGGTQIFDVAPLPFLPAPGLALAVTPDRLVLGNTAAVEGALAPRASGAPAEGDAWKRVARYVPEQAWFAMFVDNRKLLDNLAELAKKPPSPPAGGPDLGTLVLATMLQSMGSSPDAAALDRLRRYAAQAAYTITSTPQGVEFTAVQLRSEK